MTVESKNNMMLYARICLTILMLSVVGQLSMFYISEYHLVSPLAVQENVLLSIVRPYIAMAFVSSMVTVACLILYFFQFYLLVILVSIASMVLQNFYPYLF